MKLQSDVAGATFMAFGSSATEVFVSIVGELQEFRYILGFWCTIFCISVKTRPKFVPGLFPGVQQGGLLPSTNALGGESAGNEIAVEARRYSSSLKYKKPSRQTYS